jgi:hypothetical protein
MVYSKLRTMPVEQLHPMHDKINPRPMNAPMKCPDAVAIEHIAMLFSSVYSLLLITLQIFPAIGILLMSYAPSSVRRRCRPFGRWARPGETSL